MPKRREPILLVSVDLSAASGPVLSRAYDLARRLGARVELVHVVHRLKPTLPFVRRNRNVVRELQRAELSAAHEAMDDLAARAPVPTHARVLSGLAHEEILKHARRVGAQWILVGKRGENLAESLLIGSTTDRLLRKAHVPVIVVPTPRARG